MMMSSAQLDACTGCNVYDFVAITTAQGVRINVQVSEPATKQWFIVYDGTIHDTAAKLDDWWCAGWHLTEGERKLLRIGEGLRMKDGLIMQPLTSSDAPAMSAAEMRLAIEDIQRFRAGLSAQTAEGSNA